MKITKLEYNSKYFLKTGYGRGRRIKGKGWGVRKDSGGRWQVLVHPIDGVRKFVCYRRDRESAIKSAIGAAHRSGTLNWNKTLRWCAAEGLQEWLSYDFINEPAVGSGVNASSFGKGWYVDKRDGGRFYTLKFGAQCRVARHAVNKPTRRAAIIYALDHINENPHFSRTETVEWLCKNGYNDLISKYFVNA